MSIPCWEIWVLLHFEQTDAPFVDCADVIRRITARHLPHYAKADERVSQELMLRIRHRPAIGHIVTLDVHHAWRHYAT